MKQKTPPAEPRLRLVAVSQALHKRLKLESATTGESLQKITERLIRAGLRAE